MSVLTCGVCGVTDPDGCDCTLPFVVEDESEDRDDDGDREAYDPMVEILADIDRYVGVAEPLRETVVLDDNNVPF